MPSYEVEEVVAGKVVVRHRVTAPTPFRAARLATNRDITLRASQVRWIRVFEEAKRHRPYEYGFNEARQMIPPHPSKRKS